MSRPTPDQIAAEVRALKLLKSKVMPFTVWRDDNRAAIQAQIDVLENNLEATDIVNRYRNEWEWNAAFEARAWLDGEGLETDLNTMSESWKLLVVE